MTIKTEDTNPRRKYRITVETQGHNFKDALDELIRMIDHLQEHGEKCDSVGGGGSSSHIVTVDIHPTMTEEQWEKDLDEWRERSFKANSEAKK